MITLPHGQHTLGTSQPRSAGQCSFASIDVYYRDRKNQHQYIIGWRQTSVPPKTRSASWCSFVVTKLLDRNCQKCSIISLGRYQSTESSRYGDSTMKKIVKISAIIFFGHIRSTEVQFSRTHKIIQRCCNGQDQQDGRHSLLSDLTTIKVKTNMTTFLCGIGKVAPSRSSRVTVKISMMIFFWCLSNHWTMTAKIRSLNSLAGIEALDCKAKIRILHSFAGIGLVECDKHR